MDRLLGPRLRNRITGSDTVDTAEADEVIDAIAKTVAELTSQQGGIIRQQVIESLMGQIVHYDEEFRRENAASAVGSHAKHRRGSDRVDHGDQFDPRGMLDRRG